jgi:bifunctional UDP-N-acetylglucosamine pyrophosphorylase/glucosamine-1-phosphate N-acetyltransferase
MMGPNSREDLARLGALLRRRVNLNLMDNGVSIVDPETTHIDASVRIGRDTVIRPMTFLTGETTIAARCTLGPSVQIADSEIGDGTQIRFAVIEGAKLGRGVDVGPFARLRPGTVLADGVHIGSYIEVKNSRVGKGSKVPHLSYVGDADVGRGTNIGAATVTVNYDGYAKHRTVIGDEVRIGSDTMLVAPVRVGDRAVTGAGSVITKDVPAGALAVERAEQRIVKGYRKRKDAEAGDGPKPKAAKAAKGAKASKGSAKGKGSREGAR